ncbi:VOC family protein [Ottowia sp.]|uniref:VOC family protein n=1 Tax=Ottowia sp. TaxID=1898956 RepID=UPI003A87D65C
MSAGLSLVPQLDHLVIMADTLDAGVAWCQSALGVTPGPGGEHPLFGTHNRLLDISSAAHPLAYLEIIAINPQATPTSATGAPPRTRWYDMDQTALRKHVRCHGPCLTHWVARVPDTQAAATALAVQGIDRGDVLAVSRQTPAGLLQWRITVRPDGQRLMDGCLPTLIEWGDVHPAQAMPGVGLQLQSLALRHPRATALHAALHAVGMPAIPVHQSERPELLATLHTPRGEITLSSISTGAAS